MPSDLMTLHLSGATPPSPSAALVPLDASRAHELAEVYFNAYPQGVACNTLAEAAHEIRDTFAGEYGSLRRDASAMAVLSGRVVGAVLVVERSIWDADLDGPFIIDLFVDPVDRGAGAWAGPGAARSQPVRCGRRPRSVPASRGGHVTRSPCPLPVLGLRQQAELRHDPCRRAPSGVKFSLFTAAKLQSLVDIDDCPVVDELVVTVHHHHAVPLGRIGDQGFLSADRPTCLAQPVRRSIAHMPALRGSCSQRRGFRRASDRVRCVPKWCALQHCRS